MDLDVRGQVQVWDHFPGWFFDGVNGFGSDCELTDHRKVVRAQVRVWRW